MFSYTYNIHKVVRIVFFFLQSFVQYRRYRKLHEFSFKIYMSVQHYMRIRDWTSIKIIIKVEKIYFQNLPESPPNVETHCVQPEECGQEEKVHTNRCKCGEKIFGLFCANIYCICIYILSMNIKIKRNNMFVFCILSSHRLD